MKPPKKVKAWAVLYEGEEFNPRDDIYNSRKDASETSWDLRNGGKKRIIPVLITPLSERGK